MPAATPGFSKVHTSLLYFDCARGTAVLLLGHELLRQRPCTGSLRPAAPFLQETPPAVFEARSSETVGPVPYFIALYNSSSHVFFTHQTFLNELPAPSVVVTRGEQATTVGMHAADGGRKAIGTTEVPNPWLAHGADT